MDKVEILERVREVVSDVLGIAVTRIEPDDRLVDDLEAERVQELELADALEEEFDIDVNEDELLALNTVGELSKRGTMTSRSWRRWRPPSSGRGKRARPSRCACRRASPRLGCSSCGASAATASTAGSSSSTCARTRSRRYTARRVRRRHRTGRRLRAREVDRAAGASIE